VPQQHNDRDVAFMAAVNLVCSFAGFFFLVISTEEVQCMKMHKDMFKKVNDFKSISMSTDMFLKVSKKSMSMLMRVKRLDEGGIVLWASQS